MKFICIVVVLLATILADAQVISTFAGIGLSGTTGDGAPATLARIISVNGGAFDIYGNYYFPDNLGQKVRRVDLVGIISTFAGTGTSGFSGDGTSATLARLSYPNSVTVGVSGNTYIVDAQNNRVRKIDHSSGTITTIAGIGTGSFGGDGGQATAASLNTPNDICFDRFGNLYISDGNNYRVRKIDTYGIISTVAGSGYAGFGGDGGAATNAQLTPYGICIDTHGNLFIADNSTGETRIAKVDTFGIISTFAGTDTGYVFNGNNIPATTANISPARIAIHNGELYLADFANNRIRKIDTGGFIRNVAGIGVQGYSGDGGPADSAKLYHPSGVAFDGCGNLVFPDLANARIRKVTMPYPHTPATLVITANTDDTICAGTAVTYAAATPASGTVSYQWRVNGAAVGSGGAAYTYTPAAGDSVQCVVTHTMPCYIDTIASNTVHIVVRTLGIGLAGTYRAAIGSSVTVSATVTGADSSYSIEWRNRGVLFRTTTTPGVTYTKAQATDSITAAVISRSRDCTDTAYSAVHVVTVTALGIVTPFAAFQPHTYPNPFSEQLHIDAGSAKVLHASLTNMLGQVVLTVTDASPTLVLNTAPLPKGVYMLKLVLDDGRAVVERVVRE